MLPSEYMATEDLIRSELNLPDAIKDEKFISAISNAKDELSRLIYDLEALVVDYGNLDHTDKTFSEDAGDTFRFTYAHVTYLAKGYRDATDTDYTTLLTNINTAIQSNGQDALDNLQKRRLKDAGRDFEKAEVYLALAHYALSGGLRPTNDGGWITDVSFGSGRNQPMLSPEQINALSATFRKKAYNQIYEWLRDPDAAETRTGDSIKYTGDNTGEEFDRYPDKFVSGDFAITAVPKRDVRSRNPRERYTGGD